MTPEHPTVTLTGDVMLTQGDNILAGQSMVVNLADGTARPEPQAADGVSHAPRLTSSDARIDWRSPAIAVDRLIRGTTPAPGPWTSAPDGSRLKLGPVAATDEADSELTPGELQVTSSAVLVGTGSSPVRLGRLAPAGRSWIAAVDWARGARLSAGDRLGGEPA